MPLFSRGEAPLSVILDGQHAMRAILNGVIVWDGTRPALVPSLNMRVTPVVFPAPQVRAEAVPAAAPVLSVITVGMRTPASVVASSAVQSPRMQNSVSLPSPGLITNALVEVFPAEVGVVMMPAEASENFDGVVFAPPMTVSAELSTPVVTTGFFVAAVKMSVSSGMGTPIVTVSSTGVVPAVLALASVSMPAPAVVTGVNVAAVKQMVNTLMPVPTIFAQRNVNIAAPVMTVSAAVRAPVVSGSMNPQGMQRTTAALQLTTASTYQKLTPMQAKSGYESTISSDGLVMPGGGVVNLAARLEWNSGSASDRRVRIVKNGSTVLGETVSGGTHTFLTLSVSSVSLVSSDVLTLEGFSAGTASTRSLSESVGVTYLTVTPL